MSFAPVWVILALWSLVPTILLATHSRLTHSELSYDDVEIFWLLQSPELHISQLDLDDPRVVPALWLSALSSNRESPLPFLWQSWLSIRESTAQLQSTDVALIESKNNGSQFECTDSGQIHIGRPIDVALIPSLRKRIGLNYLFGGHSLPARAILQGVTSLPIEVALKYDNGDPTELIEAYTLTTSRMNISLSQLWKTFQQNYQDLVPFAQIDLRPEDFIDPTPPPVNDTPQKYFHEASITGSATGSHFDWRFLDKPRYSDMERQTILHRIARAWLRFSREAGLVTWLAHGLLLGWYWNKMNMPWDADIDVQITLKSLRQLALYNQTLVVDYTDCAHGGVHLFFIDVSPFYAYNGLGSNVIDARFIDVATGMYVDITVLAPVSSLEPNEEVYEVMDPEYRYSVLSALAGLVLSEYRGSLLEKAQVALTDSTLLSCKDNHYYALDELHPLRVTMFEGMPALVPHDYERILQREYPRGLTTKTHLDWVFRPFFDLWTRINVCKRDWFGSTCEDHELHLEKKFTELYRLGKQAPARVDPFLIRRNRGYANRGRHYT